MTVEELLKKLQECPQDFIVVDVYDEEFFDVEIDENQQTVTLTD